MFCYVRPSRNGNQLKKDRGFMSLQTPKAAYASSELQYTAAGREVKVAYLGVVFMNDGKRNK